jgi:release factor glutamine methyltransferase
MEPRKLSETVAPADIVALIRDKYDGNREVDIEEDLRRLASGEPLAYVIGWIPFLGLKIYLDSTPRPLIPRPETECWTEKLIAHLKYKFEDKPFTLLDLCAGSGAIGLAILNALPNASVSFGELEPALAALIKKNLEENGMDENRVDIRTGDLFQPFADERFDIIATNPPYIPEARTLETNVTSFEPHNALFAGAEGLDIINRIDKEIPNHLNPDGELWMECDISNIAEAENNLHALHDNSHPSETHIELDQYGRPRLLIAHFS